MIKIFSWFRKIAFAEGVSFIVLLGIAMPLKYFANLPKAVTIVGGIHGFLFVLFLVLALIVMVGAKKKFTWLLKAFVASLIPLGTFWMDKEWRKEEIALR